MSTIPLTKQSVENAGDLDFPERKREATIQIEVGPAGLTVKVAYTGSLDSIPAAIERLKQSGIPELVSGARAAPAANGKSKAPRVEPVYLPDGTACCPDHLKPLREGKWGLYCPAKDKDTGEYCKNKFAE